MTVVELKAQVLALVEQEESVEKLQAIQALLSESYISPDWEKEELARSVARPEEDKKAGRMYTLEEAKARMEKFWEERS